MLIADAENRGKKLYVVSIDVSKAFGVVWHDSLMLKLFRAGVVDDNWLVVYKWNQEVSSKHKWEV